MWLHGVKRWRYSRRVSNVGAITVPAYGAAVVAFGDKLRQLREARGLSLAQAGERAGMQRQAWHAYESGRRVNPALGTIYAMARALEVSASELIEDVDPPER